LNRSTWPGLHERAVRARERQQLVGLGERGRDRLLDQQVLAARERRARDGEVRRRRHHDRQGVGRVEQRVERRVRLHAELARDALAPRGVVLVEAGEPRAGRSRSRRTWW
jgi:hypothetical protein